MTSPPRRPRTPRYRTTRTARRKRRVVAARPAVSRPRVVILIVAMAAMGIGFGYRLADLQLRPDERLAGQVGSQVRDEVIAAPRGQILDRFSRLVALSLPRPSIVANPRLLQSDDIATPEVDKLSAAVEALSGLLSTDPSVIRERLSRDKAFVYLERQVDPDIGAAVRDLSLAGIYIEEEQRREHPNGCSGLSVAGRVDVDQQGVSGLELEYDDELTGTPGQVVRQSQAGGEVQIPGGMQVISPMEPGDDLVTTIDSVVQHDVEQAAIAAVEAAEADHAMVLISYPATGELIAMVNVVRDHDTGVAECTTTNLAATWAYEPGSILKPVTFSSVFENDAWPEFYPIDIPHRLRINLGENVADHFYEDTNVAPQGASHTPTWVLRKSSNNGTRIMAQALGADPLYETMVAFGLGEVTTLGVHGEASGILDPLDSNRLELTNAAIGQGVAVTPLQMLQTYSVLASGGIRVDPVLVMDEVGRLEPQRVISEETADTVMRMMRQVVADGTGHRAAIAGYEVAGKTGTAWQPCAGGVGYVCADGSHEITASFAGTVGNDAGAALTIVAVVHNPRGARTGGGDLAAPLFAEVARGAVRQLHIPPMSETAAVDGRVQADPALAVAPTAAGSAEQGST